MSADLVFDLAPLGSIIQFSDGNPKPPERHRKKLRAWEHRNGSGRLIRKQSRRHIDTTTIPESITLHEGDYGGGGVVVLRVHRSFSIDSELSFTVAERPVIGSILVLDRAGADAELVYVASHRADAEEWLSRHGYPNAVLQEVTVDKAAADAIEGRVA